MKNGFILLVVFVICCFAACQTNKESVTEFGFYHWQTELELSEIEKNTLNSLDAKQLYVKYFDIDWKDNQPVPLAMLRVSNWDLEDLGIVPCVFITNRTMANIAPADIPALAKNIHIKITEIGYSFPEKAIREIQIDCDWSQQTRANYFQLLEELKQYYPTDFIISATIRLHQIKYFDKTGVPPVDRGMLMYYNVGDVDDLETENSILDIEIAQNYLYNFDEYPLDLDVALPIFAWSIVFRDAKLVKIIHNLRAVDLMNDERFKSISNTRFEVQKSTYLDGYYLYKGDVIRTETIDLETLQKASVLLKEKLPKADRSIVFYHLDSLTVEQYKVEDLKNVW